MSKTYKIPSPEEIKAILAARAMGQDLPDLNAIEKEKVELADRVRTLEIDVKKKKRTAKELQQAMELLMEKYDFSPAEELIAIAIQLRDQPDKEELRVRVNAELMQYTMPKLKSVEVTGQVDHQVTVSIIRYGDDGIVTQEKVKAPSPAGLLGAEIPKVVDVTTEVSRA